MVKWYCSSSLCYNNYKTTDDGSKIKFYRLPTDKSMQMKYKSFFKTSGFNWQYGHICAKHWSSGERSDPSVMPDVVITEACFGKIKLKFIRAKKAFQAAKDPTPTQRKTYHTARKKYRTACSIMRNVNKPEKKRREIKRYQSKLSTLTSSSTITSAATDTTATTPMENEDNKGNDDDLESQLKHKIAEYEHTIKIQSEKISSLNLQVVQQTKFDFKQLKLYKDNFRYLTGISLEQFNILMDCIRPYIHCMEYVGCKGPSEKSFSFETQYVIVLMICRHGLDIRFAAFIVGKSESTISRLFTSWVVFLATLFNELDLQPHCKFTLKKMPKAFIDTGHGLTDLILDATEFKFQLATNYELNSLMFSHYKNCTTGKALIGISAHGMGILFSDVYPGSISDSSITEKTNILRYVRQEHEVMTDRGFAIQDMCAIKGVALNRPKQKEGSQFSEEEIQRNFDIAATRIHVERFIGRVRDWKILNNMWPLNRMDLLSSTWQMLCHTVNLIILPIGPKE